MTELSDRIEIHLSGAYGIDEILDFNCSGRLQHWNFPRFFPFNNICPGVLVRKADDATPHDHAILLVVNLNEATWENIEGKLRSYRATILVQFEAHQGWEIAYDKCRNFNFFLTFDRSYGWHPGFQRIYLPYDPALASSHMDTRGIEALRRHWSSSRVGFVRTILLRLLPRKRKAVLISTLHTAERYRIRLDSAMAWTQWVDVYGHGWPPDLPNYRGPVVSKQWTLRNYRFALVFENQLQPGYVTEKLLDCFEAGTVPIYWGAPDVLSDVPKDSILLLADVHNDLDKVLRDPKLYRAMSQAVHENRERVLERFSIARFVGVQRETIQSALRQIATQGCAG